ncbi:MAG: heme NO-binding domain-containing protein [Anaerolineae bacterium]|nr:heme NO-binding domain-containing protein [Anaerolineae bacterium]
MKGVIFTEFVEMVENQFGIELADEVITSSDLASGGAYTSVGSYDHREMLNLVTNLSAKTNIPVPTLAQVFGGYLFERFTTLYPQFFADIDNALDLLACVDNYIHMEVRKLYTDAELPRVIYENTADGKMRLIYRSARPFADVAEGLIRGCIKHYNEPIEVARDESTPDGKNAVFILTRNAS